jgi:hypothetical protein
MNDTNRTLTGARRHPGRLYLILGPLVALAGVGIYAAQLQPRIRVTLWLAPVLATLGLGLLVLALVRSRSVWRWLAVGFFTLFAAGQWLLLLVVLRAPPYDGPVQVGQPFPNFTSTWADGSTFTENDLKGDKETVMIFFRGRW